MTGSPAKTAFPRNKSRSGIAPASLRPAVAISPRGTGAGLCVIYRCEGSVRFSLTSRDAVHTASVPECNTLHDIAADPAEQAKAIRCHHRCVIFPTMRNMLELQDLNVEIAGKSVCRSLCLSLTSGQRWAMLGSNGIGKTTLLHTLAGLRPAAGGQVLLHGESVFTAQPRARARHIGVLFQDNDDPFPATVLETALIGRHPHLPPLAWESPADAALAGRALDDVHLAELSGRSVTTLSGGERQRLAVATLLTQDPQVWLLDEPISHLDLHHQIALLKLLQNRLTQNQGTALMTLHDVNLAARFCDHLLLLFGDGATLHGATGDVLSVDNLERLYGHPIECLADGDRQVFLPA